MASSVVQRSGIPALTRRIHFYAGLFIAPFIFIAALSGALYAVAPTLENIVYKDALEVTAPTEAAQDASLKDQIQAAQAQYPDLDVAQVWPASTPTESTRVLLIDETIAENNELRSIFVNPYTAEVIGDYPSYSGLGELPLRHWISAMHKSLHLGAPGELYAELAASWLWVVALGGLFLWWKMARTRALTGLENKQGPRRKVLNLHGVAGTWLLIGMLALSATGITWSAFGGANVDRTVAALGMKAEPITKTLVPQDSEIAAEAKPLTPLEIALQAEHVLETARAEGLTGQVRLFVPEDNAHAWQASERWVPWRLTSDAITVNGETGELVDTLPFAELPVFSKLTSWGVYLHMGIMFGLPLQISLLVLALGICTMIVLGYQLWWRRRPARNGIAGVPGSTHLLGTDWVVLVIVGVAVGCFLPLLGISFAAMLVVDRALAARRNLLEK